MSTQQKKIAVIGAGISGLTCAYNLQKAGYDVVVYEKETTVGGRMRSREKDGLWFDIGATHLIPLYKHMRAYVEEFDMEWIKMDFEKYGELRDDTIEPIFSQIGWWTRFRLGQLYTRLKNDVSNTFDLTTAVHYDDQDAYSFLSKSVSREAADYLGDAFTAAYQFHRSTEISSAGLIAILQSVKRERGDWYLHHLRNGMSALPEEFQKRLTVHTGVGVRTVVNDGMGKKIVECEDGSADVYDAVVMATIAPVTSTILNAGSEAQHSLVDSVEYAASVSYAFRVKADAYPPYSITWVPYVQNEVFSGISNEVMKGDDLRNERGESLLCTWLHDGVAKDMLERGATDEELFAYGRKEFAQMCPWIQSEDELVPHDLQRWTHAMPKFKQGLITRVADYLALSPDDGGQGADGIFLCGDYLNAPWTEGALQCGERVAAEVQKQLQ